MDALILCRMGEPPQGPDGENATTPYPAWVEADLHDPIARTPLRWREMTIGLKEICQRDDRRAHERPDRPG